jgi:hypothetical protein
MGQDVIGTEQPLMDAIGRKMLNATGVFSSPLAAGMNSFVLLENFPNPFNPTTTITFGLPESGVVRLVMYNLLGEEVRVLQEGFAEEGVHTVVWDGRNQSRASLSSGVYIYRLETDKTSISRKLILIR